MSKSSFHFSDDDFDLDMRDMKRPNFSIAEVAKMVGYGVDWLHWRYRKEDVRLDGEILEPKRRPGKIKGGETARYYTLADIERLAEALYQQGLIDKKVRNNVVDMVILLADTWDVPIDRAWLSSRWPGNETGSSSAAAPPASRLAPAKVQLMSVEFMSAISNTQ